MRRKAIGPARLADGGSSLGVRDPGGERRHRFGVGEGPAKAVAEAKQETMGARPEFCVNFVSVATGKSLLAPLATHLSTTCNPRF